METAGPPSPIHGRDHLSPRVEYPGREVPAHLLRVPRMVSDDMQKIIADPNAPPQWFQQKPQTLEEWNEVIRGYDKEETKNSCAIRDALNVCTEEISVAGVRCHRVVPAEVEHPDRLLVHTHGGAYVFGAGEAGLSEAALVAHYTRSPVVSVDYRMPPSYPFPAGIEDVAAVWQEMLKSHDPAHAAMFGSSAGGGMTMAATLKLKQLGAPLPAALFLGSPWAHLDKIADSQFVNAKTDNLLYVYDNLLAAAARLYADHQPLDIPLLSPLVGDLSGFPPSMIITGTRDLFLSLAALTHRALRRVGVPAELFVFEGASHIQFLFFPAPECDEAMKIVATFFDRHLGV
ncbi:MAG: alpha/beta hydrolase fold-3 domain protein precursor [Acidobacteria bacterium]|nr:alpha/beta hydrolase fold-3 domain protein precursor [Acidobacteriota bacterium]